MAHWASAPLDRKQVVLFSPTLDDSIREDHPVRLFDETVRSLDFSEWESQYVRVVGQPPIHPRIMAACILYGLSLGIRSSRKLEDAAANRLDFIWLLGGRVPDHATLCKFRTQFGQQIKGLFKQIGRIAIEMKLVSLNQVMLDGTELKANNSRYATNRRASLQEKLDALDRQIEQALAEADVRDKSDDQLYGESSPSKLPPSLRNLKARQERLAAAMKNLKKLEEDRGARKDTPKAPAIPTTDPDARVIPAKQGGYEPGYTVVVATDSEHGFILDVQVVIGNQEASTVIPAVENIEQNFGLAPAEVTADSGFNTGSNLAALAARQIEALMPPRQEVDASAAQRPDPSQPVAQADHDRLPINPQSKKLDRSAFIYDADADQYRCPMGRALPLLAETKPYNRHGNKGIYNVYQSVDCEQCPLTSRCIMGKSPLRRVCRDEYEVLREQMDRRMKSDSGQEKYKRRAVIAEGAFGILKARMDLRQLLLRGFEKVNIEINWVATAFNLMKLIRPRVS